MVSTSSSSPGAADVEPGREITLGREALARPGHAEPDGLQ
jgi:hypothetical protein